MLRCFRVVALVVSSQKSIHRHMTCAFLLESCLTTDVLITGNFPSFAPKAAKIGQVEEGNAALAERRTSGH